MARQEDTRTDGLTMEQGKALLWLARETIARRLGSPARQPESDIAARLQDRELQDKRGTFVSLKVHGELRGCIGCTAALDSIVEGVKRNAVHAAFNDSRFGPVDKNELAKAEIEVSILTEPIPVPYANEEDLLRGVRAGIDGVILRKGVQSATFLPQVWEQLPQPRDFFTCLCRKACLPSDAWKSGDLEVFTYRVQYFSEHG